MIKSFRVLVLFILFQGSYLQVNALHRFDSEVYNQLLSPEEANTILKKSSSLDSLLLEARKVVEDFQLKPHEWGFRLIHKHFKVPDGLIPTEYFSLHDDDASYITRALKISDKSNTSPASWMKVGNEIFVFEFADDLRVKQVLSSMGHDVFHKLFEIIERYGLQEVLAPSILVREESPLSSMPELTEKTYYDGKIFYSVVKENKLGKIDKKKGIRTSWSLANIPGLDCDLFTYCVKDHEDGPHMTLFDHRKIWAVNNTKELYCLCFPRTICLEGEDGIHPTHYMHSLSFKDIVEPDINSIQNSSTRNECPMKNKDILNPLYL